MTWVENEGMKPTPPESVQYLDEYGPKELQSTEKGIRFLLLAALQCQSSRKNHKGSVFQVLAGEAPYMEMIVSVRLVYSG